MDRLFSFCLTRPDRVNPGLVSVTHCACPDDAELLAGWARQTILGAEAVVNKTGAVDATHCRSNAVGILFVDR